MYTSTYWRSREHCSGVRDWYRCVKGWCGLIQVWPVAVSAVAVAAGGTSTGVPAGVACVPRVSAMRYWQYRQWFWWCNRRMQLILCSPWGGAKWKPMSGSSPVAKGTTKARVGMSSMRIQTCM
eukprot:7191450-Ditylum_brightwellii.AAC.1